jgi:ribonuclease HII
MVRGIDHVGRARATSSLLILGVDEAGRGSLVGPLVVGGFLAPAGTMRELQELGVRDSKTLRPDRRAALLGELERRGRCLVRRIWPATIDEWVARGQLNQLEAREFGRVVRAANPERAYVDACDVVARRFGQRVLKTARSSADVIARHHADRDFTVVAAASIVAKVHRDRWIEQLEERLGEPVGSGYPSDPRTTRLVETVWARDGGPPPWVRRSWATTERLKLTPVAPRLEDFAR